MPQLFCQTTTGIFASVSPDPAAHLEELRQVALQTEHGHDFYDTITFAGILESEEPPSGPLDEVPTPLAPWTLEDYVEEPA